MLRLTTETPSGLDCARDFLRGVVECVKRVSLCEYHYFTSKKTSGYESPKQYLSLVQFPKFQRDKPYSISKEDVKLVFEFRERYGKGVRQRSVRADTTKFNAETPSGLDCARDFLRGVVECVKRVSLCEYHYFTSKKTSGYESPKQYLSLVQFPKFQRDKPYSISKEDVKLVFEFRERYGKGVRQRSVRADTTKFNAESVIPPLLPGQVVYTLDEKIYNRLTSSLLADTMTINEKVSETFKEEEFVLSCERTRRSRTVKKTRHLVDFY
ncbi:Hypothetical predicted protein [Mytilus galloprovincialis]|uniref:Uncharacterized protein n=1 Tax=Mytilus galloprovincialis TaxID=29158 RepID=A0A8B6BSC4_MYTGA|nr:Hypothetical predicted protein [Mytilus galloprovincialis]